LLAQHAEDCINHSTQIPINLIVPDAKNAKTFTIAKRIVSLAITYGMAVPPMLTAIDFDDELSFEANEVDDIALAR
jgi:hypothetical protein